MMHPNQQGILLLPVALTLAVIGALAYGMRREGGMTVSAVDDQYEIEQARYLAASAVQLSKWRPGKDKYKWDEDDVTWTRPWVNDGGDYVATAAASVTIDPNAPTQFNGVYTLPIAVLVRGWADKSFQNYSVLLKPTRLITAKFISFNGSNKPELDVRYYLRCT